MAVFTVEANVEDNRNLDKSSATARLRCRSKMDDFSHNLILHPVVGLVAVSNAP